MTTIASHLNAQLIAARCCDALEPCESCRSKRTRYAAASHAERVAALAVARPTIPAPRTGDLRVRLAAAKVVA
jgi:hypothetical protein